MEDYRVDPPRSLTFPGMPYGTHQTAWDLSTFLFQNASQHNRSKVARLIKQGELQLSKDDRLPLLTAIHDAITGALISGQSPATVEGTLECLRGFWSWAEQHGCALTQDSIFQTYHQWCDHLVQRALVRKNIKPETANKAARTLGQLLARAIGQHPSFTGSSWANNSSADRLRKRTSPVYQANSKQDLSSAFRFGEFLGDLCSGLTAASVSGPIPLVLKLGSKERATINGGLHYPALTASGKKGKLDAREISARAALADPRTAISKRSSIINLRIEAELLIFVAQTGLNLTQAANLKRTSYRWKGNGDELLAFRVHKGRRSGEAEFSCFKSYRSHLRLYLSWLEALDFPESEGRLFPFIHHTKVPSERSLPKFKSIKELSKSCGVPYLCPSALRKTRINWLLRNTNDPALTAAMSGHSQRVMLQNYIRPNHQIAVSEIGRFHTKHDPSLAAPLGGTCQKTGASSELLPRTPQDTPSPDCISPEGCLFCTYHRDILSKDYCWMLASHTKIKVIELSLAHENSDGSPHPNVHVIERIREKLQAIANLDEKRKEWVLQAIEDVRAGRYHPNWAGHLHLLEVIA